MTTSVQHIPAIARRATSRGALLVTSTCIGGGMLAMPIQTAEIGFYFSALVLIATWIFMTFTGLLLVEATGWFKNQTHFSSMTQALLGPAGKQLSLVVYLFMNCASLVAYTSAGAVLINHWAANFFDVSLSYATGCIAFTLLFGTIVTLGIGFVGRINVWMFLLMGAIYCYLIGVGITHLRSDYLVFRPIWLAGLNSFPMVMTAFSYQMIVPSLCSYLNYDVRMLKRSIVIGTSLPFIVYLFWLLIVHGIIPFEGASGLKEAFLKGSMIVDPLKQQLSNTLFFFFIDAFAFLAVATSYIGLSIALFDFVRDFFRESKAFGKKTITCLSLLPSLVLAILFPRALIDFLDLSGGFGDALLSGLIPVGMIWVGRHRKKLLSEYTVPGGNWTLFLAGSFSIFIFIFQWVKFFYKF